MKKTMVLTMAAALLAGSSLFAAGEDTSIEARARAAINKGLDWLASQQQTNGVWSDPVFPAMTALPAWAMAGAGREIDRPRISKAVEFIKSNSQEDGGIYVVVPGRRGGALGTYNTAIAMTALHYCDNAGSTRVIQKAREYVAATQVTGEDEYRGGFGYEKNSSDGARKPYADLNNSTWVISAMRVTQDVEDHRPAGEKKVDVDWDAALGFVDRMQLKEGQEGLNPGDEGGFLYKPVINKPEEAADKKDAKGDVPKVGKSGRPFLRSYGSITYSGLLSMIYAQVGRDDPRVVSAIDYARRHWTVDENPGMGQQGVFYYFTIMARALSLVDVNVLPAAEEGKPGIAWRDELIEKVLELQKEDGHWLNPNNRFMEANPVLATSYGVLTLEYALRMFK